MYRSALCVPLAALWVCAGVTGTSSAAVVQTVTGTSSAGVPFEFEASFSISGNLLTITLCNNSSTHSQNPNDLLSSFYFDVVNGLNQRPTLTYVSAVGDVWLTDRDAADTLSQANADLRAVDPNDHTWQFRTMSAASAPFLGFGIGTVGNSNLSPNGFNGNIVGGMDYSIYAGDVTTSNLDDRLLVKECATFVFSGVSGFSEADISGASAFGLGTAPDSVVYVPAPMGAGLLGLGMLAAARRRSR